MELVGSQLSHPGELDFLKGKQGSIPLKLVFPASVSKHKYLIFLSPTLSQSLNEIESFNFEKDLFLFARGLAAAAASQGHSPGRQRSPTAAF